MTQKIAIFAVALIAIACLVWFSSRPRPATPATSPIPPIVEIPNLQPKGYVCYQTHRPITLDGVIDHEWQDAPWTDPFEDIEGDKQPKPRYQTRVKMLWDEKNLYIAAQLDEPHVWATLREHDSVIFHDNDFEVFINPDGDNHLYGELELNALNTTWDLLLPRPYKDGGRAIDAWEITGLRTAVHVDGTLNNTADTDRGWSVEIVWPWQSLIEMGGQFGRPMRSTHPEDGDQWRINFSRVEWEHRIVGGQYKKIEGKREDNWVWSPQGVIDMHRPETWGYVQFSTKKPGTAPFRPDPSLPARHALHWVYYAQKEYFNKYGVFAKSLEEVGLEKLRTESFPSLKLQVMDHDFEASLDFQTPGGQIEHWWINSESKMSKRP